MLRAFCSWLAATPLSLVIQDVAWIIPLFQTIHILALSVVLSSVGMLDLRLLGLAGRRVTISGMAERFLPWIWGAVPVMAATGAILIIGEPTRSLLNGAFQLKMILLIAALFVTFLFQRAVRHDPEFWDLSPARRRSARATALVSMSLWLAIAVCGRLIAYVDQDN